MFGPGLYPVITEKFCDGRSSVEVLKALTLTGIKGVQLREKEWPKKKIYELARIYRRITHDHEMVLIINDHIDIALAVEADGVHLGQADLPCQTARRIAPYLLIGVSTHDLTQALHAQEDGATYINIGPIFSTPTKVTPIKPLGVKAIQEVKKQIQIPFTVMGGIKEENLDQVLKAGARRVAMVTEVTQARNITEKAELLHKKICNFLAYPST